jgi:hypothetical protein
LNGCEWPTESLNSLKGSIRQQIPSGWRLDAALMRLDRGLDPTKPLVGETQMAERRAKIESSSADPTTVRAEQAKLFRELGCALEGAPYVLTGLIRNRLFWIDPSLWEIQKWASNMVWGAGLKEGRELAADFLKGDCAGARGLSEEAKGWLRRRAAVPSSVSPNPNAKAPPP